MTKQILMNGETYLSHREKLNDNFTELYEGISPITFNENMSMFVSVTGNDETGDGTEGNPYATLGKAKSLVPKKFSKHITITLMAGTHYINPDDLDYSDVFVDVVDWNSFLEIRGELTLIDSVTLTKTDDWEHTDASKNWVEDEHKFRYLNNGTTPDWTSVPIRGNGVNTLVVPDKASDIVELATTIKVIGGGKLSLGAQISANGNYPIVLRALIFDSETSYLDMQPKAGVLQYVNMCHFKSNGGINGLWFSGNGGIRYCIFETEGRIWQTTPAESGMWFFGCMFHRRLPKTLAENTVTYFRSHHFMDIGGGEIFGGSTSFQYYYTCVALGYMNTVPIANDANVLVQNCGALIECRNRPTGWLAKYGTTYTFQNVSNIAWGKYAQTDLTLSWKDSTIVGMDPANYLTKGGLTWEFDFEAEDGSGVVHHVIGAATDEFNEATKYMDPALGYKFLFPNSYPEIDAPAYNEIVAGDTLDILIGDLTTRTMSLDIGIDGGTEFAKCEINNINIDDTGATLQSNSTITFTQTGVTLNPKLSGVGGVVFSFSKNVDDVFVLNVNNDTVSDIKLTLTATRSRKTR